MKLGVLKVGNEEFGYFRFNNRGKVHYVNEEPGKSGRWTLCGKNVGTRRLMPADMEEIQGDLCKTCKKVEDTEFWGWEQML